MKKCRWICLAILVVILSLLIVGCGSGGTDKKGKTIIMRVGHATAPGAPRDKNVIEFGKRIEEISKGAIKVENYPASQLGTNDAMLEQVMQGALEAVVVPTAFTAKVTPAFTMLDLPFLFPNMDRATEFMVSPEAMELLKVVEDKGYKGLAFWPSDMKLMTANKKIEKLEDLRGMKFRVMAGDVLMNTYKAWGASAIPLPLNELYTALSQGTVDAEENTLGTIHDFKFYEVQKYIIESNHSLTADVFLVNKAWYDSLPADIQKAMVDEAVKLAEVRKVQEIERNKEFRKVIADSKKAEFVQLSDAEKQRMKEAAKLAYDEFIKNNPELKATLETIQRKYGK